MSDLRIDSLRKAAEALAAGQFSTEIPVDGDDALAHLGKSLVELRDRLHQKTDEAETLLRVAREVSSGFTLDEVLDDIYESFQDLIPYDRIGFALIDEAEHTVRARWARSRVAVPRIETGYSVAMSESSLRHVVKSGQPRIINDLEQYLAEHPASASTKLLVDEGMRSSFTCPLIADGKPVGFLFFSSMRAETYRNVHVELFMQIAGQLAMIVDKSRMYQQLVELNELKNRFLGIVVHDLRNPISIVKGYLKLFELGALGKLEPKQSELMGRMDLACETMLALINDLLDISAIESGKLELRVEPVNTCEFLREACTRNRIMSEPKGIAILCQVPADLPEVHCDPNRINQVLDNLVSNAIKFSHPGTTIRVQATQVDGRVIFAVADEGQGIPPDDVPKIFAEFSRASVRPTAGEKSTGLGLAIVKKIVQAHRGLVWVESRPGAGSTFSFSLPVKAPEVVAAQ